MTVQRSTAGSWAMVRMRSGVATDYGRLETMAVGAGSSAPSSSFIASPKCRITVGSPPSSEHVRSVDDVRRLVRLPTHGLGRQERGVGLDEEQLVGHERGCLAKLAGIRVGDVAGERAAPAPYCCLRDGLRAC